MKALLFRLTIARFNPGETSAADATAIDFEPTQEKTARKVASQLQSDLLALASGVEIGVENRDTPRVLVNLKAEGIDGRDVLVSVYYPVRDEDDGCAVYSHLEILLNAARTPVIVAPRAATDREREAARARAEDARARYAYALFSSLLIDRYGYPSSGYGAPEGATLKRGREETANAGGFIASLTESGRSCRFDLPERSTLNLTVCYSEELEPIRFDFYLVSDQIGARGVSRSHMQDLDLLDIEEAIEEFRGNVESAAKKRSEASRKASETRRSQRKAGTGDPLAVAA